jgi:uncharacterized protein
MTAEVIIAAVFIAFLAAACYSVTGFGFALVATPLLAIAWDVKSAVVVGVMLSTAGLIPLVIEARIHVELTRVSWLILGALPGIPIGVLILERLDPDALSVMIATTIIAASLLLYFAPRLGGEDDTTPGRLTAGFLSGALGSSTSMGGPPVVLYLLNRERTVASFRGTLLGYFLPGNLITLGAFAAVGRITGDVLVVSGAALPAVALGIAAGIGLRNLVQPERFRALVVALLIVTALSVLVSVVAHP